MDRERTEQVANCTREAEGKWEVWRLWNGGAQCCVREVGASCGWSSVSVWNEALGLELHKDRKAAIE